MNRNAVSCKPIQRKGYALAGVACGVKGPDFDSQIVGVQIRCVQNSVQIEFPCCCIKVPIVQKPKPTVCEWTFRNGFGHHLEGKEIGEATWKFLKKSEYGHVYIFSIQSKSGKRK